MITACDDDDETKIRSQVHLHYETRQKYYPTQIIKTEQLSNYEVVFTAK